MPYQLDFTELLAYDTGKAGITVETTLKLAAQEIVFEAKIDTGATYCVFERRHGESLGLDIERGIRQGLSTATGSFITYGHSVTLRVASFECYSTVYFAADENFTRNVLGRYGWLDRVQIGIVDYEGKLYLSRYEG